MSSAAAIKLETHVEDRLQAKRFEGIIRPYAKADVERLRGSVHIEHTLARMGAVRLWELLHTEAYVGAQGGYYWQTTGPIDNNGAGYNVSGGVNYDFWPGTALGLFIAYHNAFMRPARFTTSDNTQFLVTGIEVRHRFQPLPPGPAPVVAEAAPAAAAPMKRKIILRGVNFDFDKYNIRPDAVPILDEAARTLQEYGDVTIYVDGYTDAIGGDAYNQRLSERRANAVKEYLQRHGISASRMTARGFGKTNPVATNATAEGRAQNRRVELIVQNQ